MSVWGVCRPVLAAALAATIWAVAGAAQPAAPTFDLVLAGGRVLDPASGHDGVMHVGILEGHVAALSTDPLAGKEVVDVSGLVVAPGFIDVHVHGQNPLSWDFMARDGVTTALDLELGAHGMEGFYRQRQGTARVHYGVSAGHIPARVKWSTGVSPGHVATRGTGFMAALTRFIQRWWQPTGWATDEADAEGVAEIVGLLDAQLDEGGVGIGMGLAYTPGATPDEVRAVFELAKRRGVPVFAHIRGQERPDDKAPIESILEHVRATGASLHVLHVNSSGGDALAAYLAAIDQARADGFDVTAEVYPYTASSTFLESEVYSEGWRERSGLDYDDLQWVATGERLTEETFAKYRAQGGAVIAHGMKEENIQLAIAHPGVMIASDGMAFYDGGEHPRGAGTHARILGRYVRELGVIDLPTAVSKLANLPAERLEGFVPAMKRKGRIRLGADADLTVFDPATVVDRATFEDSHQPSAGIPFVLVEGPFVVRDGALVEGALPGRGIRFRAER
ncbi:MAG: amidohydrolase family protein [Myxococcota bacterium]